jgi:hypothetical protein
MSRIFIAPAQPESLGANRREEIAIVFRDCGRPGDAPFFVRALGLLKVALRRFGLRNVYNAGKLPGDADRRRWAAERTGGAGIAGKPHRRVIGKWYPTGRRLSAGK